MSLHDLSPNSLVPALVGFFASIMTTPSIGNLHSQFKKMMMGLFFVQILFESQVLHWLFHMMPSFTSICHLITVVLLCWITCHLDVEDHNNHEDEYAIAIAIAKEDYDLDLTQCNIVFFIYHANVSAMYNSFFSGNLNHSLWN